MLLSFRFARLLGFDFLRDRDGQWWLIEVNDVPSNLHGADCLASDAFEGPRALERIALELTTARGNGAVVILRPPQALTVYQEETLIDEDCDELVRQIQNLGRKCLVITPDKLDTIDGLQLKDGTKISSAFRRTHIRPDCAPPACTINPAATSLVCRDKLLASTLLSCSNLPSIPTVQAGPTQKNPISESGFWIIKPKFGSASRNIHRVSDFNIGDPTDQVLQPWIEPDTVKIAGRKYYYDIRILTFDGEVVGGYARCAAAPVGGIASGLPLEWLTTTGRKLPLKLSPASERDTVVAIDDSEQALLRDATKIYCQQIEAAVKEMEAQEVFSNDDYPNSPRRDKATLYVSLGTNSKEATASRASINVVKELLPGTSILDIDAIPGDWEALMKSSGWELAPQLLAAQEHFLGSRVIDEAVQSGEISRALSKFQQDEFRSEDSTSCLEILQESKHEAEVWGVSVSTDGTIRASCSADGTVCLYSRENAFRYRATARWINTVSLSHCGQLLAFGTSEPAAYVAWLLDGAIIRARKLIGHARWVNGVLAIDEHHVLTASSDGTLASWIDGMPIRTNQRVCRGHILGMQRSQREGYFYVWSSDGLVSTYRVHDLYKSAEWKAPTNRYVTTACELLVDGHLEYFAVDIQGKIYNSHSNSEIFNIKDRAWALCPDNSSQKLNILLVSGQALQLDLCEDRQNYVITATYTASPTAGVTLPSDRMMIGFSDGQVLIC